MVLCFMPAHKYIRAWFARAEEDMAAVALFLKEGGFANAACFHAQQAAEKYLKAFILFHGKEIRKIHLLDQLALSCQELDASFEALKEDAVFLTQFYIETRYPANMPEFTQEDAEQAYAAAGRIKEFVLDKLSI